MVKGIALLKRKPGLTIEQFRRHYEQVHAPLALRLFPTVSRRYLRNYVTTIAFPASVTQLDFDCITEQWFDSMEAFQTMINAMDGEVGHALRNDERKFMDRTKTLYVLVEEAESTTA